MYYLIEYIKKNYPSIIIIILLLVIIGILSFKIINKKEEVANNENVIAYEVVNNEDVKEYVNVDIKGAVKKQGIYKVEKESNINDVIKKAGGLLKNATTIDINLSKQVFNEMVIYVSTKSEYNNRYKSFKCSSESNDQSKAIASKDRNVSDYNNTTANNNILTNSESETTNNETNGKVNINTANKEEIEKIPGIGESKAEKIIDYRKENGLFKSIEDIKNVSGIGNSIYEKIKDYITI